MEKRGESIDALWALLSIMSCETFSLPSVIRLLTFYYSYQMVWTETLKTYGDMIAAEGWEGKQEIDVPVIQTLTFKVDFITCNVFYRIFIFLFIARAFDYREMWIWILFQLVFASSIERRIVVNTGSFTNCNRLPYDRRFPTPVDSESPHKEVSHLFALFLFDEKANRGNRMKEIREAHHKLLGFMKQQVEERRVEVRASLSEGSDGRHDAFTMLVKANEDEGKLKLSDEELVGHFRA